jgi:hypothetical protein
MKRLLIPGIAMLLVLLGTPAMSQHHMSNWVRRSATDTTIVRCWTDSLTWAALPPNSMNMMMMPDSLYMRVDIMKLDSLHFAHDSTFIGWCRIQAGSDSMHYNMMNTDSVSGTHNMMQFFMNTTCHFRWDSLMSDAKHRGWHPTGMKGWTGSAWVSMPGMSLSGNIWTFATSQLYSAVAFIGVPTSTTGVPDVQTTPETFSLDQNYPNPFNPTTTIRFTIAGVVALSGAASSGVEGPGANAVRLVVYDILGREVAVLVNESKAPGNYEVKWDATNVSSGVYLYRLTAGDFIESRQMVLLK